MGRLCLIGELLRAVIAVGSLCVRWAVIAEGSAGWAYPALFITHPRALMGSDLMTCVSVTKCPRWVTGFWAFRRTPACRHPRSWFCLLGFSDRFTVFSGFLASVISRIWAKRHICCVQASEGICSRLCGVWPSKTFSIDVNYARQRHLRASCLPLISAGLACPSKVCSSLWCSALFYSCYCARRIASCVKGNPEGSLLIDSGFTELKTAFPDV